MLGLGVTGSSYGFGMSGTAGEVESVAGRGRISGRALRFVLVGELMRRREVTVRELVAWLGDQGYEVPGRVSKVVSDGLRWEVRRGRVVRVGRGRYRFGRVPATTARRIRLFAECCEAWIVAVTRGEHPAPTPRDVRAPSHLPQHDPTDPPWITTAWLWTT